MRRQFLQARGEFVSLLPRRRQGDARDLLRTTSPDGARRRIRASPSPPWYGPPENVIGRAVPLDFVPARTEKVAIAVWGVAAFPTGITFSVATVLRESSQDIDPDPDTWMYRHSRRRRTGGEGVALPDDLLRFGVQLAEGTTATNLMTGLSMLEEKPTGAVLMQRGGGGSDRIWRQGWWLWPLPPEGPLAFVCEWPAQGIVLTRYEVDASPIRVAAEDAQDIWG